MIDSTDNNSRLYNASTHQLLCQFKDCLISNNFLQIVLEPVCEEPTSVLRLGSLFYYNDTIKCANYYLRADSFDEYNNTWDIRSLPFEEQVAEIKKRLKGTLLLINPYYYYNSNKNTYYKNGQPILNGTFKYTSDEPDQYYTIPIITDGELKKMLANDYFKLPNWDRELFGTPSYIVYGNHIYVVHLELYDTNNMIYRNREDSEIKSYEFNFNVLDKNSSLIRPITESGNTGENYLFFSKDSLITLIKSKAKSKEVISPVVESKIEEENADAEKIKYEISNTGKCLQVFKDYARQANLVYSFNDIYNFHTCLKSGALTILAGMTGTGKTKLPLTYAKYFNMSEKNDTLLFIPVSPSYTEPSDILGFYNPQSETYVPSETGLVELLLHASRHPHHMHLVIFDEMNLSPIELYFAPFLSLMERDPSDRILKLYSNSLNCKNKDAFPSEILIGTNVLFVGTINLDQTTRNLSDRLLDRSFILNLEKESFTNLQVQQAEDNGNEIKPYNGDLISLMPDQEQLSKPYISDFTLEQLKFFDDVHEALHSLDSQKGISFRSVRNISLYLRNIPDEFKAKTAFDYAFKQTILKKINGSSESVGIFLGTLDENGSPTGPIITIFDKYPNISDFNESRREIKNKLLELKEYGYVR